MNTLPQPAPARQVSATLSPFAQHAAAYVKAGFLPFILPVRPGTKIPGHYSTFRREWMSLKAWTKLPPADEQKVATWTTWPGAGLCIRTGDVIAVDIDSLD